MAEVQRQGEKISPEKVVRIGKDKIGRVVWLEEGDEHSGLGHLHGDRRIAQFAGAGVPKDDIAGVVFSAVTRGRLLGTSGKDRLVYELEHRGRLHRFAVSIGRKVKPLP